MTNGSLPCLGLVLKCLKNVMRCALRTQLETFRGTTVWGGSTHPGIPLQRHWTGTVDIPGMLYNISSLAVWVNKSISLLASPKWSQLRCDYDFREKIHLQQIDYRVFTLFQSIPNLPQRVDEADLPCHFDIPQMLSTERRREQKEEGQPNFWPSFRISLCTSSSLNQAPNVIECLSSSYCWCLGSVGMFTILRSWPQTKSTFLSV